jgi:DNA (cytosine-5)-methyltransferase 1
MSRKKKAEKPSAIDLFCGCGGLSLGLREAGFRVIAGIDADSLASSTFRMNHRSATVLQKDITEVDTDELMRDLGLSVGTLDLLAGCPPCQGFSRLRTLNGQRDVSEPMNDLIFQFSRFVRAFKPKTIMMENVPGLVQDPRFTSFTNSLAAMGYKYRYNIFDAADFGVPQRRRRLILLAALSERPEFGAASQRRATVRGAIDDLLPPGLGDDPAHDYPVQRAPKVLSLIKKVPKDGGSRTSLGADAQLSCHQKCDGFKDVYGRMAWSQPSPTITGGCINPSKGRFLHPEQDRAITLREAALLQGFPRTYKLDLSRGRYPTAQMIGNAFPPKFAARHAKTLHSIIVQQGARS